MDINAGDKLTNSISQKKHNAKEKEEDVKQSIANKGKKKIENAATDAIYKSLNCCERLLDLCVAMI